MPIYFSSIESNPIIETRQDKTGLNLAVLTEHSPRPPRVLVLALERRGVTLVCQVRNPLLRVAWRSLLEHTINLLEREALGLRNEEVGKDDAGSAGSAPKEEDLGLEVALVLVEHVGCDVANDEVPKPCNVISMLSFHQSIDRVGDVQFEAVDSATPFARMGRGKISPMTTHAAGPQVEAKKKM